MKYLVNSKECKAVNLANVIDIFVSTNHLMLSLTDGREMRFFYGDKEHIIKLFNRIMEFISEDGTKMLDCYNFVETL